MKYGCLKITRYRKDNIRIGNRVVHGIMPHGTTPNHSGTAGIKGMVTSVTSFVVEK